jgi:uncharacterized membrane protein
MVCGGTFPIEQLMSGAKVRTMIGDIIRLDHPSWTAQSFICHDDLGQYTIEYLESLLHLERGELATIGRDAIRSMQTHGLIALHEDQAFEKDWTLGQRLTDKMMKLAAHPRFTIAFCGVVILMILVDAGALYWRPSGVILLNLVLAIVVAVQAPLIALSQLPFGAKDRLRSEHSYLMGLKTELEMRKLSQAVTDLMTNQQQPLIEVQQALLMLLSRSEQQQPAQQQQVGMAAARH